MIQTNHDLADYPMERAAACPYAPPPALQAMPATAPVSRVRIWDGSTPWLITGHAEQRIALSDPRISVDEHRTGFPHQSRAMAETLEHRPPTIFNTDAPGHTRIRRMLTRAFTAKRVAAQRPMIQQITDDLIDAMLAGRQPADLVPALALPLPSLMISAILGVPYSDHGFFQEHSGVAVDRFATAEQSAAAATALVEYLGRLIEVKRGQPSDDVVSDLAARVDEGELTTPEAALMGVVLLIAGHETSANMIALGTLTLLQHPDQLALLRDTDDPAVVAGAVEEMLRFLTVAHTGQRRIAVADIEIGGELIRAGEGVVVALPAGNWDPAAFPEPARLDLRRSAAHHHAFGFGIHQCVGQQLARVELQVVYGTLYRRIPTLALAVPFEEIEFKHDALAFGVHALPVTW
jgi:cytochrome P450